MGTHGLLAFLLVPLDSRPHRGEKGASQNASSTHSEMKRRKSFPHNQL